MDHYEEAIRILAKGVKNNAIANIAITIIVITIAVVMHLVWHIFF